MKKIIIFSCLVLFLGGLMQLWVLFKEKGIQSETHRVGDFRPVLKGWTTTELPIAETEFLLKKTESILKYDEYKYYDFSNGERDIKLYVARWKAGTISPKEISWHNPDVCWVANGWRRVDARSGVQRKINGMTLKPTQERTYRADGQLIYVMFWHVVGGKIRNVELSGIDPWYAFLRDISEYGLDIRQEQLFIRLSTNIPLDDFIHEAAAIELLEEMKQWVVE